MKFIRKALWPTAIVAAALMLFGALGNAINADTLGNVQSSTGDNVVEAGEEVAIYVVVSADATTESAQEAAVRDAVDAVVAATEVGDVTRADLELRKALIAAEIGLAMTNTDPPVPEEPRDLDTTTGGLVTTLNSAVDAFNGDDGATLANDRAVAAAAKEITDLLAGTPDTLDDTEYTVEVDGTAEITKVLTSATVLKAQRSGRTSADVKPVQISADAANTDLLKGFDLPAGDLLLVVVECTSGGFDISFDSNSAAGIGEAASFDCQGSVAGADISASKSTVYSADSAKSVITVTIEDEDGTAATPGGDVDFATNACVFGNDKNAQTVQSEADGDDTIAEATLDCSGVSAGAVTVTARIDKPGRDVLQTTTVTVIGPPASLTVTAGSMMENLTCGEVVTLTINVVDSADQPVANGTVVNLTTNRLGVLVAPASTSGGVAIAHLITSPAHVGSYAVVAQSGSAVGYITVSCEAAAAAGVLVAPAPAPVEAPAITPPSTGDAGLAETSGSSWMLLAIAGALASVMVAVGKGLPSFFRR